MSAVGAPTHPDAGKPRADFCVSDLKGKTASREAMALVVDTLKSYGYSVSVNDPYVGNELIGRHGDPARGVDSIQVEINKKLFMDTATFRKTPGFDEAQGGSRPAARRRRQGHFLAHTAVATPIRATDTHR